MASRGEVTAIISQFAIDEVRRNLGDISAELVYFFDIVVDTVPFEFIHPSKQEIMEAAKYVPLKDAPIIAGAKKAKVDLLVTLDKKHFLGKLEIDEFVGAKIITPKEAVKSLKGID